MDQHEDCVTVFLADPSDSGGSLLVHWLIIYVAQICISKSKNSCRKARIPVQVKTTGACVRVFSPQYLESKLAGKNIFIRLSF